MASSCGELFDFIITTEHTAVTEEAQGAHFRPPSFSLRDLRDLRGKTKFKQKIAGGNFENYYKLPRRAAFPGYIHFDELE